MTERTKKILFAVFFVSFSLGMGYLLFVLFFRAQTPVTNQPIGGGTQQPNGTLPIAGGSSSTSTSATPGRIPGAGTIPGSTPPNQLPQAASRIHVLRDGLTQAVSPSTDGNGARFYNPDDGRFYKVNADSSVTTLGEKQFFNVQKVSWGNTTDKAILEFPDQQKVFYDFTQKRQATLPKHWSEFEFSPNDAQVASKSIGIDPENRFLITSNPDGTEARALEALGENGDLAHISWSPTGQIVGYALTGDPQGEGQQEILFVGQHHENFKSIIAPGADFLPNWSPNGKQILFSVWSDNSRNRPSLWVTSGDAATMGAGRRNLNLATWADKCVWADEATLYCGVPRGLPDNAGLQRGDFATLPDDIYKIDLKNGTSIAINTAEQTHPIKNPVLSNDRKRLIFSDAESGKLISYDLP